jgi:hypothetical protein
MAQLHFPVSQAGLIVPVWIGLRGNELASRQPGQLPAPLPARGLLDTGTDLTAAAPVLLRALGVVPTTVTSTTTAGGQVRVRIFEISLSITDPTQSTTAWLTEPNLSVMELPAVLPDADVLVGLDILLTCKLELDGPARHFMLEF